MAKQRVLVPLAPGFEELEAVAVIDVLRRAGVDVVVAALGGPGPVTGSHGIAIAAETNLADLRGEEFSMVVLPGGMPGAAHLRDHPELQALLARQVESGRYTAAICAAPMALGAKGRLAGKTVTSYPGYAKEFAHARYVEDRVVVDGKVVTSRGPGTALEFALTLVERLVGADVAKKLEAGMLVARPAEARVV